MRITIDDFTGGLQSLIHPTKLQNNEFPVYENTVLKSYGDLGAGVKRFGFNTYNPNQLVAGKLIQTLFEAEFSTGSKLIGNTLDGSDSTLKYTASPYTGTWTLIDKNARENSRLQPVIFKDKVYISNLASSPNYVWDGTNYLEMGCPPCDNTSISGAGVTLTGGGLTLVSTYYYWIIFVYDGFQNSGCLQGYFQSGFLASLSGLNNAVSITNIPVSSNARCTQRLIFRSKANDSSQAYYLTCINDNITTKYNDLLADSALGTAIEPVEFSDLKKPYIAKYQTIHKDRLIQANLSENLYLPLVDSTDITFTPADTGGSMGSGYYKYKVYKMWLVNNNGFSEIRVSQVLDKTVDMHTFTGTDNKVTITFNASVTGDNWYKALLILRTPVLASAGATASYSGIGLNFYFTSGGSYVDTLADASLADVTVPIVYSPEGVLTNYSSWLAFSDVSTPDLFPVLNIEKIGQDDGDHITNIFSEQDRIIVSKQKSIHIIDTRPLDSTFWYANKAVNGIGANDYAMKQIPGGYAFKTTRTMAGIGSIDVVYIWDGRNDPVPIGEALLKYTYNIFVNNNITFKDMVYDESNKWIWLVYQLTDDSTNHYTYYFIYSLLEGKWQVFLNSTDFTASALVNTKSYGVLLGDSYGYLSSYDKTVYQDKINGSNYNFTQNIRTKTFLIAGTDLEIRNIAIDIEATGAAAVVLYYSVDGTERNINLGNTASGFNRMTSKNITFTGANDKPYREIFFRISISANVGIKILSFTADLNEKHSQALGR